MNETNKQEKGMESIRKNAIDKYHSLEMPILRYGLGIYVDLADLKIDDLLKESNTKDKLRIDADLKVKIVNLAFAEKDFLDKYFDKLVSYNENKLTALHYAVLNDALAIIIPKGISLAKPILINSNLISKSKSESIIVIAEENSKAAVIEISESSGDAYFKSQIIQVYAEKNSELTYCSLQNLNEKTYNFSVKRGEAKGNAKIKWVDVAFGGKFSQLRMRTELIAPGAITKKYGVFFGNGKQQFDLNIESIHKTHHTESSMHHRGVLNDYAKSIFRGTVKIDKNAYGSIGHQKSDVILLGENAKCDAVPILDVENDEVVCSHGMTMGQLDPDQIFYLLSRGLNEDDAKKMILLGFLEPLFRELENEELREKMLDLVDKKTIFKEAIEVKNASN